MKKHLVIPDCQVKPEVSTDYLEHVGNYIAEHEPDTIIQIGDFADMPSLSSYDVGKKEYEGRRYKDDVESVKEGMARLMRPIQNRMRSLRHSKKRQWKPGLHLTLGNHENRILRAVSGDPKLYGTIGTEDLGYEQFGWTVHPFLTPTIIDNVCYSHYFTSGVMGRPVTNARMLVQKKLMSCVMGHVQHWDIHRSVRADGRAVLGLFVGSCYEHDEDYLGPQGNNYDRGIWMLNEVEDGSFMPMYVSLGYLRRKYG